MLTQSKYKEGNNKCKRGISEVENRQKREIDQSQTLVLWKLHKKLFSSKTPQEESDKI